jgi:chemotaxis protein methyltransferase CheR
MIPSEPTTGTIDRAAALLHSKLGLRPDPPLRGRLARCLRDEAIERQVGPEAYLEALSTDARALQDLYDRVTVQETSFFRHPGQFEALSRHVLPRLPGPVSIWSAGCANGQEAYSLAMVLDELGKEGSVIATDVSTRALQRTAAARYMTRELSGLSAARRDRYLVGGPDSWEVRPSIRDRVTVQHHNLVHDTIPPSSANCDIVFCRNVLIYFSPEKAKALLARLAKQLPAGAYLFLGYAETIWQVSDLFEPVRIGGSFEFHRRRQQPSAVSPVPAPPAAARLPTRSLAPAAPRTLQVPNVGPQAKSRPNRGAETTSTPASQALDLARAGQLAANAHDYPGAITAFRKCVYLAPDEPIGHVHLALALEASGDLAAAARAFGAARAVLGSKSSGLAGALGGYQVEELVKFLNSRQENVWG